MIGLDRPKLVALAQLLGGDYCEGVAGEDACLLHGGWGVTWALHAGLRP